MTIHERFPFAWKESRKPKVKEVNDDAYTKALKADVAVLDLKTRSYNALKRASINTIGDLIPITLNHTLPRLRNVGVNSALEIHTKLLNYLKDLRERSNT